MVEPPSLGLFDYLVSKVDENTESGFPIGVHGILESSVYMTENFIEFVLKRMIVFAGINAGVNPFTLEPGFAHDGQRVLEIPQKHKINHFCVNGFFKNLDQKRLVGIGTPFALMREP